VPGAVLGRARDRGQAVLCHAQDELQQPLEQRATGRNIQRFNGTHIILLTSPLSGLKIQRAALDLQTLSTAGCLLFSISETSFTKLCANSACRNSHDYRLHSAYFIIGYSLFFGHAKVMLHSRIAANRHRCSQVNQECRLWFQDFIMACRIVKISIGLLLFLG
jgi:hypothetical protein